MSFEGVPTVGGCAASAALPLLSWPRTAVVVNGEVSSASTTSYLRVVPYGKDAPVATQHVVPGRTISNLVVVKLQNGKLQAKVSTGTAPLVFDIAGSHGG